MSAVSSDNRGRGLRVQNEHRLTEFISNYDLSGGFGGLAHAGRVAAVHAKAVGFTLSQVKECKARRLDWHASVHPLPGVRP